MREGGSSTPPDDTIRAVMRRLVVLTPYAVWPPRHGGAIRVAGLLGHLGDGWQVIHFSQSLQRTDVPMPRLRTQVSPRWTEHKLVDPLSWLWIGGLSKVARYPAAHADSMLAVLPHPRVRRALATADCVLVSPHYQMGWVRKHTPRTTPLVVDQHNIEREVWRSRGSRWSRWLAGEIAAGERRAWADADLVLAVTEREAATFISEGAREVLVVPNGVDVERFRPAESDAERARVRASLGGPPGAVAVFVGGAGYANRKGLDALEQHAAAFVGAGITVVVVGRLGIGRAHVPGFVRTGEVAQVSAWLQAADVAVCPLLEGGGTSLKMVEYLAAGLPVVSTAAGARGLDLVDSVDVVLTEIERMPEAVAALIAEPVRRRALADAARRVAVDRFSWQAIGASTATAFDRLVDERRGARRLA
jgi:glycosyltransferase involved in cell wall biosynthesis